MLTVIVSGSRLFIRPVLIIGNRRRRPFVLSMELIVLWNNRLKMVPALSLLMVIKFRWCGLRYRKILRLAGRGRRQLLTRSSVVLILISRFMRRIPNRLMRWKIMPIVPVVLGGLVMKDGWPCQLVMTNRIRLVKPSGRRSNSQTVIPLLVMSSFLILKLSLLNLQISFVVGSAAGLAAYRGEG